MQLFINGKPHRYEAIKITVKDLLISLGYTNFFVAVAVNHECVPSSQLAEVDVQDGDTLEILAPMAGG